MSIFTAMKKRYLDKYIEMFAEAEITPEEELKNNKQRAEWLEAMVEKYGLPERDDEGAVTFVHNDDSTDDGEGSSEDTQEPVDDDEPKDEPTPVEEGKVAKAKQQEGEEVVYMGKVVTEEENVIMNGRRYIKIHTSDGTVHVLSTQEYEEDVTTRKYE